MSAENLRLVETIDPIGHAQGRAQAHPLTFSRAETPSLVSISTEGSDELVQSPMTSHRSSVDEAAEGPEGNVPGSQKGLGFGLGMERTRRYGLDEDDDEDEEDD